MSIMIPDVISDSASDAKKKIFEQLKGVAQSRNWEVLHSITINSREIDFVILVPDRCSVICLKVATNDSYDLVKEALGHAKKDMEALRSEFPGYFQDDSLLFLGSNAVSVKEPPKEVKEPPKEEDIGGKLTSYIFQECPDEVQQICENWGEDSNTERYQEVQLMLDKLRSELVSTGETITTIATVFHDNLETHRPQLLRLTDDQLKVLQLVGCEPPPTILPESDDRIQINSPEPIKVQPRCVVDGAAGTGKTVLAIEIARQLCESGKTVGMLCSNPYLSQRFVNWAETLSGDNGGKIIAGTPAKLPLRAFRGNSNLKKKHEQRLKKSPGLEGSLKLGYLDKGWQDFIVETIKDLDALEQGPIFDYLIVDEAQNLCAEMFLNLQNALLKGGLKDGCWIMFGDFTNQQIVSPNIKMVWAKFANYFTNQSPVSPEIGTNPTWEDVVKLLREIGLEGARLEVNCRNTHEIADKTAKLVRLGSPPMLGVHGPHVQIEYFNSQENLTAILDNLISDWQDRNFKSKQIILLSSGTGGEFNTGREYSGWELLNIAAEPSAGKDNTLKYSDVYDFQGLESDLVILVLPQTEDMVELAGSLTLPREKHLNRVLYTGMSRARVMLVIVADEHWERILKRREHLYVILAELQQAKEGM